MPSRTAPSAIGELNRLARPVDPGAGWCERRVSVDLPLDGAARSSHEPADLGVGQPLSLQLGHHVSFIVGELVIRHEDFPFLAE